ncbi:MAG TPA: hypothetical protein ENF44_05245 [Deltaproteobacteria bacterium]|nr:hypothetical protein [Deltaproteobacteria bacterium]
MSRRRFVLFLLFGAFLLWGLLKGIGLSADVAHNFWTFSAQMVKILPCAFVLIGLFEVWVKKEAVEKHLGRGAGPLCYLWAVLLAATTVGGMYVAFPVAHSLYRKGAKLGVIFTYVGAAAICRIPMTVFEASFLGVKFTAVRFLVSLPLLVLASALLGRYLESRDYRMIEGPLE